jgi:hypothetical protein
MAQVLSFRAGEGDAAATNVAATGTHNGCVRFFGDEWKSVWRISIQPRAFFSGEGELSRNTVGKQADSGYGV